MGLEGLAHAAEIPIASDKIWELQEVENLAIGMQATRYLARKWPGSASLLLTFDHEFQVASLVFLLYDIISTIDLESEIFAPSLQLLQYVPHMWAFSYRLRRKVNQPHTPIALFRFRPSPQFCVITSSIYVWGTCIIVAGVMSVLITRVWLLYFRNPWVLISLLTLGVLVSLPPILIISIVFKQAIHLNENPAPDVIPGCLFGGASKWSWVPYIGTTLYETLLFALTVYKAANIFTIAGSKIPIIYGCATGSGLLGSIMSAMCSRMLLSTKSIVFFGRFESERHERIREQVMSISETIRVPRFRRNQDLSYWGIIEVDRTRLHIASGKGRDGELAMREEVIGIAVEEEAQSQLAPLPVMYIPGGPGLRSGWIRRDSEGEIVVK
ncbi:hypothetical protein RhiXN_03359 [Rhizoctonia solani]|uniref:Uncharacterized protein n=1 Tax=Rhizoctonia solani TaxID=456999 RepID=A0A8H8NTP4_9AGAM|nr:uncharacterized protein RhiXN_03359 [Rhizoctonia solani]QRW18435.1 hypothetical protein RhiXN_03359 [Rhizoctonia solani]